MGAHFHQLIPMIAATLLVGACAAPAEPQRPAAAPAPGEAALAASFINRVWRVSDSSDGSPPGSLYVFLSEGTLLITSDRSKPMLGRWQQEGGALTMVEDSIPYKVDILHLSAGEFRIRSNNPGGAVDIRLVPAP